MEILTIIIVVFVAAIVWGLISGFTATPEQSAQMLHGQLNLAMVCPHCNASGTVRTKAVTQKKGVSGGKVTAAILTGGVSMLATGLSRKEANTQAYCTNCKNTWLF